MNMPKYALNVGLHDLGENLNAIFLIKLMEINACFFVKKIIIIYKYDNIKKIIFLSFVL